MSTYAKGVLCVIAAATLYGVTPSGALLVFADGVNEVSFIFWRYLLTLPVLYLLWLRQPQQERRMTAAMWKKLPPPALGLASCGLMLVYSYPLISTGVATTLHFSYPVFTLLGCALFYRDRITPRVACCVALTLLGVVLCYSPGKVDSLLGLALAFLSGIGYATYVVSLGKSGLSALHPIKLTLHLDLCVVVLLALFMIVTKTFVWRFSALSWLVLFLLAMSSFAAMVLFQVGVKQVGPQSASVLSTFEPLTAVVLGLLLLGEPFTWKAMFGVLFILAAVLLLTIHGRAHQHKLVASKRRV